MFVPLIFSMLPAQARLAYYRKDPFQTMNIANQFSDIKGREWPKLRLIQYNLAFFLAKGPFFDYI